jgi:hypothetical protein
MTEKIVGPLRPDLVRTWAAGDGPRAPHFDRLDDSRVSQGLRSIDGYENCAESAGVQSSRRKTMKVAHSG